MAGGVGKEDLDLLLRGAKAAPTHTMMTTTGWLGKKGGGEAADAGSLKNMIRKKVEPWNARFFVLPAGGRTIRWDDSAEDAEAGMTEKGSMDIPVGQTRFVLKEVDGKGVHRFSLFTAQRELKLRAKDKEDFEVWEAPLRSLCPNEKDAKRSQKLKTASAKLREEKAYDRVMRLPKETVEGPLEAGGVDGGGRASTVAGEPSYFVIAKGSSLLCRYKSEAAYADGKSFPEEFELDGASFFLKAKKADAVVFIVDGPDGLLELRAAADQYYMWEVVLATLCGGVGLADEEDEDSFLEESSSWEPGK